MCCMAHAQRCSGMHSSSVAAARRAQRRPQRRTATCGALLPVLVLALAACTFHSAHAQLKYTNSTLPGYWWDVNDDLNEQCEKDAWLTQLL